MTDPITRLNAGLEGRHVIERDLEIVGKVDRRHPALTELSLDVVAAFEGCIQAGDGASVVHEG